jgi:hypothetical protein
MRSVHEPADDVAESCTVTTSCAVAGNVIAVKCRYPIPPLDVFAVRFCGDPLPSDVTAVKFWSEYPLLNLSVIWASSVIPTMPSTGLVIE